MLLSPTRVHWHFCRARSCLLLAIVLFSSLATVAANDVEIFVNGGQSVANATAYTGDEVGIYSDDYQNADLFDSNLVLIDQDHDTYENKRSKFFFDLPAPGITFTPGILSFVLYYDGGIPPNVTATTDEDLSSVYWSKCHVCERHVLYLKRFRLMGQVSPMCHHFLHWCLSTPPMRTSCTPRCVHVFLLFGCSFRS